MMLLSIAAVGSLRQAGMWQGECYGAGGGGRPKGGAATAKSSSGGSGGSPRDARGTPGVAGGVHPAALGQRRRVGFLQLPGAGGRSRGWCGAEAGMRRWGCHGAQLQSGDAGGKGGHRSRAALRML